MKEDSVDAFKQATIRNHLASIDEPGVLRFDVLQSDDIESEFLLYEVYRDDSAVEEHKRTKHYSEWKEAVTDMMASDRERASYGAIAPSKESDW